jgi:hypothetical protein
LEGGVKMKDKVARTDIKVIQDWLKRTQIRLEEDIRSIKKGDILPIKNNKARGIKNFNNIGDIDKRVFELENTVRVLSKQNETLIEEINELKRWLHDINTNIDTEKKSKEEVFASIGERMSSFESNMITLKQQVHEVICEHKDTNIHVEAGNNMYVYEYCNECGKIVKEIPHSEYYKIRAKELIEELKQINEQYKLEIGEDMDV